MDSYVLKRINNSNLFYNDKGIVFNKNSLAVGMYINNKIIPLNRDSIKICDENGYKYKSDENEDENEDDNETDNEDTNKNIIEYGNETETETETENDDKETCCNSDSDSDSDSNHESVSECETCKSTKDTKAIERIEGIESIDDLVLDLSDHTKQDKQSLTSSEIENTINILECNETAKMTSILNNVSDTIEKVSHLAIILKNVEEIVIKYNILLNEYNRMKDENKVLKTRIETIRKIIDY